MVLWIVGFVVGLAITAMGSRRAVTAALAASEASNISPGLIGLTVVAVGTDLPEIANSIVSALTGHGDVAVGDATGSAMTQVTLVLDKMVKQRRESIVQFEKAGRDDLIVIENNELEIIIPYLPEQLGEDEINALIDAALEQTGASSIKDMGKVMGQLKPQLQGKADMSAVSALIKSRLG